MAVTSEVEQELEQYRRELTGYCYRMLGSAFEAEDAVQETMIRAWRGHQGFEGRAALRSWLYRIATNVCLDALKGRQRRARPMDLTGPVPVSEAYGTQLPEVTWIGPVPDAWVMAGDPAELAAQRESVRLAFVAALQRLAPRQRAVLILREVVGWSAAEVAELLETTVASVNSAMQRARAALAAQAQPGADAEPAKPLDPAQTELLAKFVSAFESFDLDRLAALLHEDVVLSMPPFEMWIRGLDEYLLWLHGPGGGCRGSRLLPVSANGAPAFAQYRPAPDGGFLPWALQVLDVRDGRITGLNNFLDTDVLFPLFGLPLRLDG